LRDNYSFAEVPETTIAGLIEEVVREGCDAAVVLCTNMHGANVAKPLEQKLGVPVYDSIAVTLWACMAAAGVDPSRVQGWGSLFATKEKARA
jgi:maleate isomerase